MLGNRPTIHVGEAHELFRRVIQQIHLGGLSNVFISEGCPRIKQIFFCLETVFIHGMSVCEGVGEDLSHGIGYVGIRVRIMNSLECVCLPLHCTLVGSNPCRIIPLLGIAHPVKGKIISGAEGSHVDGTHPRS